MAQYDKTAPTVTPIVASGLPYFQPTSYKSGVFTIPSLGLIIFKNGSQNSGLFTYYYWVILKATTQEQPNEQTHKVQSARSFRALSRCTPSTNMCFPTWKFSNPYLLVF